LRCNYGNDKKIDDIIAAHGGFVTRQDLTSSQYHRLLSEVAKDNVVRIRRGVFALPAALANTMYDIDKIVPEGVLCNFSAWSHYGLTTQIPLSICIAIEQKRKVRLPEYPPITLFYQSKEQLSLGRIRENFNGYEYSSSKSMKNR